MSKTLPTDVTTDEAAEFKAAIEQIFVEIERNREQMQRDQQDIDRSKARTRGMLTQLEAA